jgi:5-amino-6-(5-phospho-D-ribitylamino)uracil phosphatase
VSFEPLLLAFDLDGTLVPRDQPIPSPILEAIWRVEDAGHFVTVITGRTQASAQPFLDQLRLRHAFGTTQGARVSTPDGRVLFEAHLSHAETRALIAATESLTYEFFVATGAGERFYVIDPERLTASGRPYWGWALEEGHEVLPFSSYADEPVGKVVFHSENAPGVHAQLRASHPHLNFYPWETKFLEVTHSLGHKGAALELIALELGVPQSRTIAFGDGNNDLTMLEWAGRGVAVGFGSEADDSGLAQFTVAPPEDGGVALWLEQHVLAAVSDSTVADSVA